MAQPQDTDSPQDAPAAATHGLHGPEPAPRAAPTLLGLDQVAAALGRLAAAAELDVQAVRLLRARSVVAGEEVRPGEGALAGSCAQEVEAGRHFTAVGPGVYRAERYGYLSLSGGRLEVASPLWADPAGLTASWLVLDGEARPVTTGMIMHGLGDRGVVEGIDRSAIERVVAGITVGRHECGAVCVAAGRAPKHGRDAVVQLVGPAAGANGGADTGRWVRAGEVIARRTPATRGVSGITVQGAVLPARDGCDRPLMAGDNVRAECQRSTETLRAAASGVVRMGADTVRVVKVLTVRSGAISDTGSLNFSGQVRIAGSVGRGFSVKAEDAVLIGGSVEPGASVQARGDVQVRGGVLGGRTHLVAGGSVWAGYVEEATIVASADISVAEHVTRARLVAGRAVSVGPPGSGMHAGCLQGGQVWAGKGICAGSAGSRTAEPTVLAAGLLPEQAERLDRAVEALNTAYGQLVRHLERFGLARLDTAQIRTMIAAATGPRRMLLAATAQRLARLVRLYRSLASSHGELRAQIEAGMRDATVEIAATMYAGVTVRLGHLTTQSTVAQQGPFRFHAADGRIADSHPAPAFPDAPAVPSGKA